MEEAPLGIPGPISRDEEILELFAHLQDGTALESVIAFDQSGGETQVRRFIGRHEADMDDGVEPRVKEALNYIVSQTNLIREADHETKGVIADHIQKSLQLITTVVQKTLQAAPRATNARGPANAPEPSGSVIQKQQSQRDLKQAQQSWEFTLSTEPMMQQLKRFQSKEEAGEELSNEELLKRQGILIGLKKKEYSHYEGLAQQLKSEGIREKLEEIRKEIKIKAAYFEKLTAETYGHGAAAMVDRSLGRAEMMPTRVQEPDERREPSEVPLPGTGRPPRAWAGLSKGQRRKPKKSEQQRQEEEKAAEPVPTTPPQGGYILKKQNSADYLEQFGVKASSVEDLYRMYNKLIDYPATVRNIWNVMRSRDRTIALGSTIPQQISKKNKSKWKGKTFRGVFTKLTSKKTFDFDTIGPRNAFKLIRAGDPTGRGGKAHGKGGLIEAPGGMLPQMFDQWKGMNADVQDVNILQLFRYQSRKAPPKEFTGRVAASMVGEVGSLPHDAVRERLIRIGEIYKLGLDGKGFFRTARGDTSFWELDPNEQFTWMKSKGGTGRGGTQQYRPEYWYDTLKEGFGVTEAEIGKKKASYSAADAKKLWINQLQVARALQGPREFENALSEHASKGCLSRAISLCRGLDAGP